MFEGRFNTVKQAVEAAVRDKVSLAGVNLRSAKLNNACLDEVCLKDASLWGASLIGTDLAGADLQGSDCRNTNFKNSCMAEVDAHGANFHGSYFSNTLVRGTILSKTRFSCSSILNVPLCDVASLEGAIYDHDGSVECDFSVPPIVVHGLPIRLVIMKNDILLGTNLYHSPDYCELSSSFMQFIIQNKMLVEKTLN